MKEVKVSTVIGCSAKECFDFTLNPDNTPKWVKGVVKEETNEAPTRLGTIYRNQAKDGGWAEFEITAFEAGHMFEMTKKDDNHHVRYIFNPLNNNHCELEYRVHVDSGEVSERFSEDNIQKILQELKAVIEE